MKVLFDVDLDGDVERVFMILLKAGGIAPNEKERKDYFKKLTKGIVVKGIETLMTMFIKWRKEIEGSI